ncbi:DUF6074 family protein [Rhizobium sp. P28RR-XV]|uniref:DUF6074 family protein n=1 Tax=Rhizobium sp. P28RR-XV TaxID=2726737 RepID=UPI001456514C|nr:DUF6074 family protein [Rhizobium sp. P28RR-XV]NLR88643.1 hypothetical protein [Rhizobium sp. P28RR-XV]
MTAATIAFPAARDVGNVRDVAAKILDEADDRQADHYRLQVTEAIVRQLDRIGIPAHERDEQLGAFWQAVQHEMIRQCFARIASGNDPRGTA